MATSAQMTIPKSRSEVVFNVILSAIVVFFLLLAVFALLIQVAIVASCLWIVIVAAMVSATCKSEGGFRKFLINRLGDVVGRKFVETSTSGEIRFGYQLLGYRFLQRSVSLNKVASVEWSPGQASGMAGRDMNDWIIGLWFDRPDPIKRKNKTYLKADQNVYVVGPSRRKEDTRSLGLSFVAFLCSAGLTLVEDEKENCFVRIRDGIPK